MSGTGCPVIVDQLLYTIHRRMEQVLGHSCTPRPIPPLVEKIGQVDLVPTALQELAAAIHGNHEGGWLGVEEALEDYAPLQEEV